MRLDLHRLVQRLRARLETRRDALDDLVQQALVEEGDAVAVSVADGRDHPVQGRCVLLVRPPLCCEGGLADGSALKAGALTHHVADIDDESVFNWRHGMPCLRWPVEDFQSAH